MAGVDAMNDTYTAMIMREPGAPPEPVVRPRPDVGLTEVLVRVRATSMNYHDLVNLRGVIRGGPWPRVPMSDGAGEIAAVGAHVRSVAVGDRVMCAFSPRWTAGRPTRRSRGEVLGDTRDGCLQQYLAIDEAAVVRTPTHLTDLEAATLPCAGVTAWRALQDGGVGPGDVVVAQGTGGVSMFVVLLAKAMGATVVLTSSSDEKLAIGKTWGADHLVNYTRSPDWERLVLEATVGRGADLVVDVGGKVSLAKSIAATGMGGAVAIVGVLDGAGLAEIPYTTVMMGLQRLFGVAVGSVADLDALARAAATTGLRPHISHQFDWSQIGDAMALLARHQHVGKIGLTIP